MDVKVGQRVGAILGGVIFLVVGLILSGTVLTQAETSGKDVSIGSFSGARDLNDILPMLYYVMLVTGLIGGVGIGTAGFAGKGPLA